MLRWGPSRVRLGLGLGLQCDRGLALFDGHITYSLSDFYYFIEPLVKSLIEFENLFSKRDLA